MKSWHWLGGCAWLLLTAGLSRAGEPIAMASAPGNEQPLMTSPSCCQASAYKEGCCQRFWDWLWYRPLHRGGCCCQCESCCMPPLYAFFPCRGGPGVSSVAGCNCGGGFAHGNGQLDMVPNNGASMAAEGHPAP